MSLVTSTPSVRNDTVARAPMVRVGADASGSLPSLDYALSAVGAGLGAYHGYKRNESIGWAVGWGLLGGMFPILTTAVAFGQGFGEKSK